MAGRSRPSFLKKQKEEQRRARAARKREERRTRKQGTHLNEPDAMVLEDPTALEEASEPTEGDAVGEEDS